MQSALSGRRTTTGRWWLCTDGYSDSSGLTAVKCDSRRGSYSISLTSSSTYVGFPTSGSSPYPSYYADGSVLGCSPSGTRQSLGCGGISAGYTTTTCCSGGSSGSGRPRGRPRRHSVPSYGRSGSHTSTTTRRSGGSQNAATRTARSGCSHTTRSARSCGTRGRRRGLLASTWSSGVTVTRTTKDRATRIQTY